MSITIAKVNHKHVLPDVRWGHVGVIIPIIEIDDVGSDGLLTVCGTGFPHARGDQVVCVLTRLGRSAVGSHESVWTAVRFANKPGEDGSSWKVKFALEPDRKHHAHYLLEAHAHGSERQYVEVIVSSTEGGGVKAAGVQQYLRIATFTLTTTAVSATGTVSNPGNMPMCSVSPIDCNDGSPLMMPASLPGNVVFTDLPANPKIHWKATFAPGPMQIQVGQCWQLTVTAPAEGTAYESKEVTM